MILLLRGHIRDSFDNDRLYNLVRRMKDVLGNFDIYIHTWHIFQNSLSWRINHSNENLVFHDTIYNYFRDLRNMIKCVVIENDNHIKLHGNLDGLIHYTRAPIKGWKNYWTGKYDILNHMNNIIQNKSVVIVNTRFDIMNNYMSYSESDIINFIKKNKHRTFNRNVFVDDNKIIGIDNLYMGTLYTQHTLAEHFYFNLDDIIRRSLGVIHQEELALIENRTLFN